MEWVPAIYVIDFEGSPYYGIVEYGIVCIEGGRIQQTWSDLCRAKGHIPRSHVACHGILGQQTLTEAPFEDHYELFCGLRKRGLFAAHNARFENDLLRRVWPYASPSSNFLRPETHDTNWGPWLDTYWIYRQSFPRLNRYKLRKIIESLKMQPLLDQLAAQYCPSDRRRYHCALYDALAASLLLVPFLKKPLGELIQLSLPPSNDPFQLELPL